jgi:hypothetical protein
MTEPGNTTPKKHDRSAQARLRVARDAAHVCRQCGAPAALITRGGVQRHAKLCQPHLDEDAERRARKTRCVVCAGGTGSAVCAPCTFGADFGGTEP